jgi:hypothetical protein
MTETVVWSDEFKFYGAAKGFLYNIEHSLMSQVPSIWCITLDDIATRNQLLSKPKIEEEEAKPAPILESVVVSIPSPLPRKEYSTMSDLTMYLQKHGLFIRNKACNYQPPCRKTLCAFVHCMDDYLAVFRHPFLIAFYRDLARIKVSERQKLSRPQVQELSCFTSRCKVHNMYHCKLILQCSVTQLLKYPELIIYCSECTKKRFVPIYGEAPK